MTIWASTGPKSLFLHQLCRRARRNAGAQLRVSGPASLAGYFHRRAPCRPRRESAEQPPVFRSLRSRVGGIVFARIERARMRLAPRLTRRAALRPRDRPERCSLPLGHLPQAMRAAVFDGIILGTRGSVICRRARRPGTRFSAAAASPAGRRWSSPCTRGDRTPGERMPRPLPDHPG